GQHLGRARRVLQLRELGGTAEAESAQLHVAGKGGRAEQLGQRAAGGAPVLVHFEETVLRVYPAVEKDRVIVREGADVSDAVGVARDVPRKTHSGMPHPFLRREGERDEDYDREKPASSHETSCLDFR